MRWLAACLLLVASSGAAQIRPMPGDGDPRLQTVAYDPDQIVQLAVASGFQLMVGFGEGERIETIAVGDSATWQVTANKRGDHLFVKSVQDGNSSNLTVVTNARTYIFELVRAGSYSGDAAYVVRFTYPRDEKVVAEAPASNAILRYKLRGDRSIRPSLVDIAEGQTLLEWPAEANLPAIFRIDDDGAETLINGEMIEGQFVVEGTPKALVFRLDKKVARAVRIAQKGSGK
jgi:type IV secretion system protein VirB9